MNIRDLELFRHLATTLHFARTSQECHITPSGLTRTIQRLESQVGEQLFLRNNRSVSLTPAGRLFRDYADETLGRFRQLQNNLQQDSVLRGELSIYCSVTAILSILPAIFTRFRKTHPQVQLQVQTGDAAQALQRLQSRQVTLAIAAQPEQQWPELEFIELTRTPLICIYPRTFPETIQYHDGSIDWQRTPVILPREGLSRTRAEKWFAENSIRPYIYSQVSGNEAIIAMVSMGCGVGIVPRLVLEKSSLKQEVKILEQGPILEPFIVGACTLRQNRLDPIVQSFWNIVAMEMNSRHGVNQ